MKQKQRAGGIKIPARQIAFTSALLALCIGVQQFKALSQFITGPLVNAILVLAVLRVGLWSGMAIAVLSPALAFLIAPAPVLLAVPQLLPLIMLANAALALCVQLGGKKRFAVGLILGIALKPLVLFLGVLCIVPGALSAMFSVNQLITAVIGGALAWMADRVFPTKV